MKNSTNQNRRSYTDLVSTNAVKSPRLSLLWLMLFTLLFVPTRMVAKTTDLFNNLEGITDAKEYTPSKYCWEMLDLNAQGMENLGFKIPNESTGLMSGNYMHMNDVSEIEFKFTVEKPLLLTFKFLVSSSIKGKATITLDDKESWTISGENQMEIKALLSADKHSLKLYYDNRGILPLERKADRALIYDLHTATTFSEYVAAYDATNTTLTFKKITSDNLESLDYSHIAIVEENGLMVQDMCSDYKSIKNIVFEESFKTYDSTSLKEFFKDCNALETISGLEYLNTKNAKDMNAMFSGCSSLTSLDLTNFNTTEVTDMSSMFSGCSALTAIYASDEFVTTNVTKGSEMFKGCENLKGFIEYKNNTDKDNNEYANYKTGYFSKLVGKNGEEKIGAAGETLTAESLALDDEKDFVAYEPFAATTASYSREMKANTTWATLCLPFDVSLAEKNFRAFKLLSANEATNTVELEEIETNIAAGTPVIIKMNEGETQLNFTVADQAIAKEVQPSITADGNYQLQGLYTQKEFSKDADNNCYIVKGNKLMNPAKLLENENTKAVGSKPFRAYMVENSTAPAGAKMFSIGFGDSTTAIDNLNTIADDKAEYYDLQGHRLNAPQTGINIVKRGGKTMKVIIK